jgi:hypothetical protein
LRLLCISASVDSGFGCLTWVLGVVGVFWEGFSGFLFGFGVWLGWGALEVDLGVFGDGFDGGFNYFLGFEFHVDFGCYRCFLVGRT